MNREVLESQWPQIREILSEKFSNLTDEDIRQINGRYDQLVAKLQQKYGYSREEAEERIRSWNFDRFAGAKGQVIRDDKGQVMREDRARKVDDNAYRAEDNSSMLKWLLGLGLPLLLLGLYFLSTANSPEVTPASRGTSQEIVAESPADRVISSGLRDAFNSQPNFASQMRNIQITTNNGVVTLSGTVPSREVRDNLVNTAQSYNGVRQVIDRLTIR
ncbi:MAG: BON domain-containing protein [Parachlamydiaceae bacterium]|nr:BON domain-containing protein [Parachlamydiaceae bacterium]